MNVNVIDFSQLLKETSNLLAEKAEEADVSEKSLAYVYLKRKMPVIYKMSLDLAFIGYDATIVYSNIPYCLNYSKIDNLLKGNIESDFFFKKMMPRISLFYVGNEEILESLDIVYFQPKNIKCHNTGRRCIFADNAIGINISSLKEFVESKATNNGKCNYFELERIVDALICANNNI